jgi:hypothetical protein
MGGSKSGGFYMFCEEFGDYIGDGEGEGRGRKIWVWVRGGWLLGIDGFAPGPRAT